MYDIPLKIDASAIAISRCFPDNILNQFYKKVKKIKEIIVNPGDGDQN